MNHAEKRKGYQAAKAERLPFRSLFLHAWDFSPEEIDRTMGWVRDAGLNTMCVAGTYHSGWFLHPHSHTHRAFMTEGSVCYFQPQTSLWKKSRLRPHASKLCADRNPFAEISQRLEKFDLRLVSWTIGCHNSRLGLSHPELTQQNVYGDHLPHALCPVQPAVREYLLTLCRDLATNYPLWAIQLEAFGWMNFHHGHHHERDLVGLTPFEQDLMSVCVCPACSDAAAKANVDVVKFREQVKSTLDGVFQNAPYRPKTHPRSLAEFENQFPAARKFNAWRQSFLHSLITSIKQDALAGTDCRILLQTSFDQTLADTADGFACGAYGKTPTEVMSICSTAGRSLPRDWNGLLQCFIQLGMGIPKSETQLRQIIAAVEKSGCNGINFYNYSETPPKMLVWLKNILSGTLSRP